MLVLLFILMLILVIIIWTRKLRRHFRTGALEVQGKYYAYSIDRQHHDSIGGVFAGMEIELDKPFYHLYIDGHSADRLRGPRYRFKAKQKLNLEGDFNEYFQVYASPAYHRPIMTLLTPDMMGLLITYADRYDIEIDGKTLRIISTKYSKNARAQIDEELIEIAHLLLPKVVRRLSMLSQEEIKEAATYAMDIEVEEMIKIGKRGVSSATLALFLFLACTTLPAAYTLLQVTIKSESGPSYSSEFWQSICIILVIFPGSWILSYYLLRHYGRRNTKG